MIEQSGKPPPPVRVVVGTPGGRRASAWRVWFGNADVYAGFRVHGGIRKASIHYPRTGLDTTLRYVGFTRTYAESISNVEVTRLARTHVEWPGAEVAPGYFVEFRFRVPDSELRVLTLRDETNIIWIDPPGADLGIEVTVMSGPGSHSGPPPQRSDGAPIQCLAERYLPCDRRIWVLSHIIAAPPIEEMSKYHFMIRHALATQGKLPEAKAIASGSRVNMTFECPDGSAGEWELAGDFLLGQVA